MRLANRLISILLGAMAVILVTQAALRIRRETAVYRADMERDHATIGRALGHALAEAWEEGGEPRAMALADRFDAREPSLSVRWISLERGAAPEHAPWAARDVVLPATLGVRVTWVGDDAEGQPTMYTYVPVPRDGAEHVALELSEPLSQESAYVRSTVARVGTSLAVLLGVFSVVIPLLGRAWVGRPVDALIAQVRRVGQGDLTQRIPEGRSDELGVLAVEVNRMTDTLAAAEARASAEADLRSKAEAQLQHADRLRLVGLLAAGVVHDIGTPLNVIRLQAQLLGGGTEAPPLEDVEDAARGVVEQCDRITEIARRLLDFARPGDGGTGADVGAVARRTLALAAAPARRANVRLVAPEATAVGAISESDLQQVLMNLVVNAIQAQPGGGSVVVVVREDGDAVALDVRDEGTGIRPEDLPRLFDPYFSTKPADQGTGLGLAVTRTIVERAGGRIQVESEPGRGTTFTVYLKGVGPGVA